MANITSRSAQPPGLLGRARLLARDACSANLWERANPEGADCLGKAAWPLPESAELRMMCAVASALRKDNPTEFAKAQRLRDPSSALRKVSVDAFNTAQLA